jgi:hypothetical protein
MKQLSPAAQAVLDAAAKAVLAHPRLNLEHIAAAALCAAADRTMDLIGDVCHPKYMEGIEAASDFLEHLAAELDPPTTPPVRAGAVAGEYSEGPLSEFSDGGVPLG